MGLECLLHPRVVGQADFYQATSDWALKVVVALFCRSWLFSAEVHPHSHAERRQMQAMPCQGAPKSILEWLGLPRWESVAHPWE